MELLEACTYAIIYDENYADTSWAHNNIIMMQQLRKLDARNSFSLHVSL